MSIIVNLSDSIAMNDTIIVKVMKASETWRPVINEVETNSKDVWIVVAICVTVVIVVGLIAWVMKIWIAGKKELLMEELQQKKSINAVECKKHEMEIEQLRQDQEVDREQKKKGNELKNKKTAQDIELEKWEAEHRKEENKFRRERYEQETEQAKLDAELKRKIREKEPENEKN